MTNIIMWFLVFLAMLFVVAALVNAILDPNAITIFSVVVVVAYGTSTLYSARTYFRSSRGLW